MKKIAVLTSGGDSQGMNAAIYAVVRYGISKGMDVYGVFDGYKGLINDKVKKLVAKDVDNIVYKGGTVLGTSRCPEMKTDEGKQAAAAVLAKHGIEGLVVIGGDGSFQGAKMLSTMFGIKVIGIPGTIDNDLAYTDYTLGFDSAVTVVVDTIKMLRDTMACNDRSCVVEVMGRRCGDIALHSALTSGAEAVLVPESPLSMDELVARINANAAIGKYDNIIIVAEGVGHADEVRAEIERRIPSINIRSMVVGHIQRGGNATVRDRLLGIEMGELAVNCLEQNKTNRVIGIKDNKVFEQDMLEALSQTSSFDEHLYRLANDLVCY